MNLSSLRTVALALAALLLLDIGLTVQNIWPTFGVYWAEEPSLDLAVLVLLLALHGAWRGRLGAPMRWLLGVLTLLFVVVRYADVTAPALFGRSVDLYWDLPHVPDVVAMFAAALPAWQVAVAAIGVVLLIAAFILFGRWAVGAIDNACAVRPLRRVLAGVALLMMVLYGIGAGSDRLDWENRFAAPVSGVIGKQTVMLAEALLPGMAALADHKAAVPPLPVSDLARLGGGDAFLIFFESYGALVFDENHYRETLAAPYAELSATLARKGWHSISAFVDSPTFGGGSWLAHSTMLYGVQTTRHGDYGRLLKSHRDNLTDRFRAEGYRTVALMPGIQQDWPEGAALGVDAIHDAAGLAYAGTSFGWWRIPDQFSLNWLARHELNASPREPLFVFYPTISSHFPFSPVPPYLADWNSFDGPRPYGDLVPTAHGEQADPAQMKQNYLDTIGYDLRLLAGFLDQRVRPGSLLIVLGDHQPPAIVSGKGASVSVPVHVFATDERLLEPYLASGFVPGLVPSRPSIGPMAMLPGLLLNALDGKAAAPMARAVPPVSP